MVILSLLGEFAMPLASHLRERGALPQRCAVLLSDDLFRAGAIRRNSVLAFPSETPATP